MLATAMVMMLNCSGFWAAPPVVHTSGHLESADRVVLQAVGIGKPPAKYHGARARLMAERAAHVVATRNLLAKVSGVDTTRSGAGHVYLEGRLAGVRYLPTVFHLDGSAEVVAEVELAPH